VVVWARAGRGAAGIRPRGRRGCCWPRCWASRRARGCAGWRRR